MTDGEHAGSTSLPPPASTSPSPAAFSSPSVVVVQSKDPGSFCGTNGADVEEWRAMYERVNLVNRWDPTLMLANMLLYLRGTAKVWYENHEEELTSWRQCKQKVKELFGQPAGRKIAAKQELASRAQPPTDYFVSYIQDVLTLCRKADHDMTEAEKVGHVLKGIVDDASCSSVDAIVKKCRRFEQPKSRRVLQPFAKIPITAATSTCEDQPTRRHQRTWCESFDVNWKRWRLQLSVRVALTLPLLEFPSFKPSFASNLKALVYVLSVLSPTPEPTNALLLC